MKLEMGMPYCSYLKVFRINDIEADEEDFGASMDADELCAPEYGCGDRRFFSNEEPQTGVLDKYHITYEEWETICNKLEYMLDWGRCALCQ